MTTSRIALFGLIGPVLCALLPSCASEKPVDPLASATGFCGEWGKNVCVEAIVQDCASPSVSECQQAQRDFCLDRVSEDTYTGQGAAECLAFLRDAYRDEALERDERDALVRLGEPCDKLLSGSGKAGSECNENKDCNTLDGLECIIRFGETRGECQEPRLVTGGGRCASADSVCKEADQYCNGTNCVAKSLEDEPCDASTPCDDTTMCEIQEGEEEGVCVARRRNGDACTSDGECRSALCDRNEDEEEGFCVDTLELTVRVDICESFR
jgi:hypothetical protein